MGFSQTVYRDRRAVTLEDDHLEVIVMEEGGHVAVIRDKRTGINPLWTPPWETIEHSAFDAKVHSQYGGDAESKLLAGILGHNLAVDLFGPPSAEEAAAGLTVHGEASTVRYRFSDEDGWLAMKAELPLAHLSVERRMKLGGNGVVLFEETVTNQLAMDRPLAWTQHVTLGPPFLEPGATRLYLPARQSFVSEDEMGAAAHYKPASTFEWPNVPRKDGGTTDLSVFPDHAPSTGMTTHLVDRDRETAFFAAWHPAHELLFGYRWRRSDYPWIGLWEENRARMTAPWNGVTVTRGVEFGASTLPETRRAMVERGSLFGEPSFRWLPAKGKLTAKYEAFARHAEAMPSELPSDLAEERPR